jgi:hypothetical protein
MSFILKLILWGILAWLAAWLGLSVFLWLGIVVIPYILHHLIISCVIVAIIIFFRHRAYERKEELVIQYFLCRQMGTLFDVVQYTNLSNRFVKKVFKELERKGKIEFDFSDANATKVYRWTENIDFPEGITSEEIQI